MSIIKLNNRSVKDVTAFGSISSLGSLTHIATQTASSSASLSFTSGIDSTYKEYIFYFVNIHPATDGTIFHFQGSTDGGSNYNTTMKTTYFRARHNESDSVAQLSYDSSQDQAQGTSYQPLAYNVEADNDQCCSGTLQLFNPSSTTFSKHYISRFNNYGSSNYSRDEYSAGYFNTTSAINGVSFKFASGNIDSGQILLFGLN